jgi:two-component system chemotaxis response regulator CheY
MSKTVMVIEDSSSFRTVVALALKRAGYQVVEAANGNEAVDRVGKQPVDLFVCDVNMPGMDGIAFVSHLRAQTAHRRTPVVMLTTETSDAKKALGREAGASAWMTKPFQPSKLVELVASLIK